MKKYDACVVGYYGMKNTGDDALLMGSLWGAKRYFQAHNIAVTAPADVSMNQEYQFAATLCEQQQFKGHNRLLRYQLALQSRHIIFGGGSVFHNHQDISIKNHMMRLAGNHQHIAIGVGLGPFVNTQAEKACAEFLKRSAFTGLRDTQSVEIAQSLASDANFQQTFDLAPLLLHATGLSSQSLPRQGIAVNLCPKESLAGNPQVETIRLEAMALALSRVHFATGEPIYLINFNGHEQFGDGQLHCQLKQLMPTNIPVSIVDYDPNPVRVLQRLAMYKAMVSMRLHGAILAFLAGTPQLSLNYHDKCVGWCEQVGMDQRLRFDAHDIDVPSLVSALNDGIEHGFPTTTLTRDEALKAAEKNWLAVNQLTNSNQRLEACA